MTRGPTIPPVVSVDAPLYAMDLSIIAVLLAVALILAIVLLLRRRGNRRSLGGE